MIHTVSHLPYSKDNPFPAVLRESRMLSKPGSEKETMHFVVDIHGSGFSYSCGDSLGVYPSNDPDNVDDVLVALKASGLEEVQLPKSDRMVPLRDALMHYSSLAGPTRKALEYMVERTAVESERALLADLLSAENKERMQAWLAEREYLDLMEEFPGVQWDAQDLISMTRRLVPRLYSIASSPSLYPQEIHLTVAVVRYHSNNRRRHGVCSTYLAERVPVLNSQLPVFVAHSHFGLTEDNDRDIIMVGPGTGIAPFRAFLQERKHRGAKGKNWLFFGDQRRSFDYLYEDELEQFHRDGLLGRLDLAFSRDQANKVYVQDRMRENSAELWRWIDGGAVFYVCGDAKRMAKDVDAALHEVIATRGGMTPEQSADYVKQMKKEKRYLRDVY